MKAACVKIRKGGVLELQNGGNGREWECRESDCAHGVARTGHNKGKGEKKKERRR